MADPLSKSAGEKSTYEALELRAGRAHMVGEKVLPPGSGVAFGLPLGKLSTLNHWMLAIWLRYLSGPDGRREVLAMFAYFRKHGFMSYLNVDETWSRSHDYLCLAAVLLIAAEGIYTGEEDRYDDEVLAECRWWLRGYVMSHRLHRFPRGGHVHRAKDAPHAAMAGARDPGNGEQVDHKLPVNQTALRDEIVATLEGLLGMPKRNLGVDSLDRSALWALTLPGMLSWATKAISSPELSERDLPPLRYPYKLQRDEATGLFGRWGGDLKDMLRPSFWVSANFTTGVERYGVNPSWGKEDEGHLNPPAVPFVAMKAARTWEWPVAEGKT